jgi:hypothetical protein
MLIAPCRGTHIDVIFSLASSSSPSMLQARSGQPDYDSDRDSDRPTEEIPLDGDDRQT